MLRLFVLLKTTKAAQKVIGTHSMTIRYEEEAKRSFGERMHVYVLYNGMVSMLLWYCYLSTYMLIYLNYNDK